jgi:hypothetical protein
LSGTPRKLRYRQCSGIPEWTHPRRGACSKERISGATRHPQIRQFTTLLGRCSASGTSEWDARFYVASLAEETSVLILLHYGHKFFGSRDFGCGFVAVPLQIGTLPVHLPQPLSPDKGDSGKGVLTLYLRPIPLRTKLEQLDALT